MICSDTAQELPADESESTKTLSISTRTSQIGSLRPTVWSDSDEMSEQAPETPADDEAGYVTGFPLACIVVGLMLAVFLISLDRTIISTVSRDGPPGSARPSRPSC